MDRNNGLKWFSNEIVEEADQSNFERGPNSQSSLTNARVVSRSNVAHEQSWHPNYVTICGVFAADFILYIFFNVNTSQSLKKCVSLRMHVTTAFFSNGSLYPSKSENV